MSKFLKAAAALALIAGTAQAESFDLGRPALPEEIAAWDIDVRPDGAGLPEGEGDVWTGEEVFADRCAVCHGDFGEAVGRWPVLAGGQGSLTNDRPVKTIGSYWPYLSTVWDYVHRAMPFGAAQSLTPDETYAITAYLLYLNDVVDDDFTLSRDNFLDVRLPNEDNFYPDDRDTTELVAFSAEACMTDCKESVEITMRAAVLDVTPEETKARQLKEAVEAARKGIAPEAGEAAAEATTEQVAAAEPATDAGDTEEPAAEVEVVAFDPELVAAGEKVFRKCKACHEIGEGAKNKSGPQLNDVIGRALGSVAEFKYSKAFQSEADAGRVWDEASLAEFLARPKKYIKGTKMSFAGLKKDDDIAAVLEYLKANGAE